MITSHDIPHKPTNLAEIINLRNALATKAKDLQQIAGMLFEVQMAEPSTDRDVRATLLCEAARGLLSKN